MSLVSSFTFCEDGRWYKELVYRDAYGGKTWFICFDDDDPVELVIRLGADGQPAEAPAAVLSGLGIECEKIEMRRGSCGRLFGSVRDGFTRAVSCYLYGIRVFPIPRPRVDSWDAVLEDPPLQECAIWGQP